jgi:hypothetical protein
MVLRDAGIDSKSEEAFHSGGLTTLEDHELSW